MTVPPLRELIEAVIHGLATPEQQVELERQLLDSVEARDEYLNLINLHAALRRRFLTSNSELVVPQVEAASAEKVTPRIRRAWSPLAVTTVLLACTIAAGVVFWPPAPPPAAPARLVGVLQLVEGSVTRQMADGAAAAAQVGETLRSGDTLHVAGEAARAVLAYPDGTTVQLHRGAVVAAPRDGPALLELHAGSMEVDAAAQPPDRPLIFSTSHMQYVVLGTRFRLYCEHRGARLELDEGKVRLERPAGGEQVEITSGSVAIATDEQAAIQVQPLSRGTAQLRQTLRHAGERVAFSPDGERVFTSRSDGGLQAWHVEEGALDVDYRPDTGYADGLEATPDGAGLVQLNRHGYLLVWPIGTSDALKLPFTGSHIRSRALAPDGLSFVIASAEATRVYRLDLPAGRLEEVFACRGPGKPWCVDVTPECRHLAVGYWNGTIQVHALPEGDVLFERRLQHTPTHIALAPDGQRFAVFTQRDGLVVFDLATGTRRVLRPPGSEIVRCLRFTSDGSRVLAGLHDQTARMWLARDGRQLLVVDVGYSPQGIAWSETRQMLATADGTVSLWQCAFTDDAPPAARKVE